MLQLSQMGRQSPSLWNEPRWRELMSLLEAARKLRPAPQVDEKIISAWNGLMLSALAYGARLENGQRFRQAGKRLMITIRARLLTADRMVLRSVCGSSMGGPGFLDDYAYMARGLLDWVRLDGDDKREVLDLAGIIIDKAINLFAGADGALHISADHHQSPLRNMHADFDNAVPSPSAVFIGAMMDFDAHENSDRYTHQAQESIARLLGAAAHYPTASATILAVMERHSSKINTSVHAEWRTISATTQDDGRIQILIQASLPPTCHFQQAPQFRLISKGDERQAASLGRPLELVDSSADLSQSPDVNTRQFFVRLVDSGSLNQKRMAVSYTLCDDHMCHPEMHTHLDLPIALNRGAQI